MAASSSCLSALSQTAPEGISCFVGRGEAHTPKATKPFALNRFRPLEPATSLSANPPVFFRVALLGNGNYVEFQGNEDLPVAVLAIQL